MLDYFCNKITKLKILFIYYNKCLYRFLIFLLYFRSDFYRTNKYYSALESLLIPVTLKVVSKLSLNLLKV